MRHYIMVILVGIIFTACDNEGGRDANCERRLEIRTRSMAEDIQEAVLSSYRQGYVDGLDDLYMNYLKTGEFEGRILDSLYHQRMKKLKQSSDDILYWKN